MWESAARWKSSAPTASHWPQVCRYSTRSLSSANSARCSSERESCACPPCRRGREGRGGRVVVAAPSALLG
jgi:hypothetical protein